MQMNLAVKTAAITELELLGISIETYEKKASPIEPI